MVMQFYIIPMISGIASVGTISTTGITTSGSDTTALDASQAFLYLLIIQGLFSGLTIGKLSEGSLKPGIKHSFALVALAFLVSTLANVLLG
jgi:hypothetical protein